MSCPLIRVGSVVGPHLLSVAAICLAINGNAAEEKGTKEPPAVAAIRATAKAYVDAFNRGDAQAVAALWTENGSVVDASGAVFRGRAAIQTQYAELFKQHPGAKIGIAVGTIELPTATTAVEDGLARVKLPGDEPSLPVTRYTAYHVLENGQWRMASVRETHAEAPANALRLQALAGLVGKWEAKSGNATVRTEVRWIAGKSYLQRDYTVLRDGNEASSGVQIIGWDPQCRQFRSWSFDSLGGHGTGLWSPTADGWRIESTGVLADGTPTSSRDFVIRVPGEDNVLGWRSVNRTAGELTLPDTQEVVLDRVLQPRGATVPVGTTAPGKSK